MTRATHIGNAPRESGRSERDKPKRGGNRGRGRRSTLRRINAAASERQAAWAETGKPNVTERLTGELDVLYGEHRGDQAGTLTDPYYGRTWGAQ